MVLENQNVLLRPVERCDLESFLELTREMTWDYFPRKLLTLADLRDWYDYLQLNAETHAWRSFTIIDKASNKIAGSTSYTAYSERDSKVEIGWTWLGKPFQGTGINQQCKFLLIENAIENEGIKRVELKTDTRNEQSRKALKKIGATEEGMLRSHSVTSTGFRRDVVYFSILAHEWPSLKKNLL